VTTFTKDVINDIISWIEVNIDTPLSVQCVAEYSGYSKWHLQRIFKKETGLTLGKYIRNRKLTLIAQNLKNSNEPILSLACRYGFESQQSFTRSFTHYFSVSPHRYRTSDFRAEYKYIHQPSSPGPNRPVTKI
jgi:AraC-like DNA-binding protein